MVAAVGEVGAGVLGADACEAFTDGAGQGAFGARTDLTQVALELAPGRFDGVEVSRVGRQVKQARPRRFDEGLHGATLVRSGGLYRVLPAAAGAGGLGAAGLSGGTVVPLRYAAGDELAKVLQPYAQNGAKVIASPDGHALVISGDPSSRDSLVSLARAFDVDVLAGQSYALLPVTSGDAQDFATALTAAFRSGAAAGAAGASGVRIVPMARIDAVLAVGGSERVIEDVRRVYALVEKTRRRTVRSWHVYYLQNSRSNDIAYVLQQAFTPNNVTAQPPQQGSGQRSGNSSTGGSGGFGSNSGSQIGGAAGLGGGGGSNGLGGSSSGGLGSGTSGGLGASTGTGQQAASNPLLGGLDTSAPASGSGNGADQRPDAMRIIPNAPEQRPAGLCHAGRRRTPWRRCCARSTSCRCRCASTPPSPRSTLNDTAAIRHAVLLQIRRHQRDPQQYRGRRGPRQRPPPPCCPPGRRRRFRADRPAAARAVRRSRCRPCRPSPPSACAVLAGSSDRARQPACPAAGGRSRALSDIELSSRARSAARRQRRELN